MGKPSPFKTPTLFLHEYVTGGGFAGKEIPPSWAAEGAAMRRALVEDFARALGYRIAMTLDARLPDEHGPRPHVLDRCTTVRVGPGEELATFARLAAECDYTLCVAPETGGILEARARLIESVGGYSLGSSAEAIALCGDKLRMGEHVRALGIETPMTIRVNPRDGLPRDFPYPAVLKPIDGAGSVDTYFVESPDDLPTSAREMKDAILQPFAPGTPMSASFLVDARGRAQWVGVGKQIVSRSAGHFVYEGGIVPFALHTGLEIARAVESVPGLLGWVGVDFLADESSHRITLLEINPRVTTSYVGWRAIMPNTHAPFFAGNHDWNHGELARWWLASLLESTTTGRTGFEDYELRLLPSVNDVKVVPREGKNLIVVAEVSQVLHVRIFDSDSQMVVDTDEKRLTYRILGIERLKQLLERLWPPHDLTANQKNRIIKDVIGINDYRQFHSLRAEGVYYPLTPFWRRSLGPWPHSRRVARFSADGVVSVEASRA